MFRMEKQGTWWGGHKKPAYMSTLSRMVKGHIKVKCLDSAIMQRHLGCSFCLYQARVVMEGY